MQRTRQFVLLLACVTAMLPCLFGQGAPSKSADVLIKNAIVMTVTHGNIKNGSIYIKDGKIAAVGENVNAPAGATVIDAGGQVRHARDRRFAFAHRAG